MIKNDGFLFILYLQSDFESSLCLFYVYVCENIYRSAAIKSVEILVYFLYLFVEDVCKTPSKEYSVSWASAIEILTQRDQSHLQLPIAEVPQAGTSETSLDDSQRLTTAKRDGSPQSAGQFSYNYWLSSV